MITLIFFADRHYLSEYCDGGVMLVLPVFSLCLTRKYLDECFWVTHFMVVPFV